MSPLPRPKTARYGPKDRYDPPPAAGFCISVFAVLRRRGKLLAGRARMGPRWRDEWLPSIRSYAPAEQREVAAQWRLPGAYLLEGEHPERALARVMRTQLGIRAYRIKSLSVGSWTAKSDWYPGHRHWDLGFVYEVAAEPAKRTPRWWEELDWFGPADLRKLDFGWSDDLVRELAPTPPRRKRR
ncbi:MAG TPA: hypothetical protein VI997_12175 [Candidatus Thermoplasmatota archaeon]|nr:hypothetical protein [Candidatus Thermoplasmatota archaeon]